MKQVTVVQYWWGCFTKVTFPYEMWYICIFFFKLLITIPSFLSLIPSLLHAFNLTSKFNYSTIHSLYHCFSLQPFHHSFLHYSFLPSPLRLCFSDWTNFQEFLMQPMDPVHHSFMVFVNNPFTVSFIHPFILSLSWYFHWIFHQIINATIHVLNHYSLYFRLTLTSQNSWYGQ